MFKRLRADLQAAKQKDPAAGSKLGILLTYPGIHALMYHRFAHRLYKMHLKFLARVVSQFSRFMTGIEIHPGATIGKGVFIDHGMGVVIGETAVVNDNCMIFQGVTLGGTGKEVGKRHPTLEEGVTVYANASVLGNIIIGKGSKVGAGAVVLKTCPPESTLVGIPARIVGTKLHPIDVNKVTSPCEKNMTEIQLLKAKIKELEECMQKNLSA